MDHDIVRGTVAEWGAALRYAMRTENRARLTSPLFDVQRRQIIGYESYYAVAPVLVRELQAAGLGPEVAATEMRRLLRRPYFLQIFELIINPLLAREQRLLARGEENLRAVAAYDAEQLPALAEYVSRLVRAYRGEDRFGPTEGNDAHQQILEPDDVRLCAEASVGRSAEEVAAIRRTAGSIGLHSVLLHGEHRDGIFDHGPYPGPGGTQLLVREINDLRNDYLPWSTEAVRLSASGIAIVHCYRDVDLRFDLFGGASTDPVEISPRVERIGILARIDDAIVTFSPDQLSGLADEARAASRRLYTDVTAWPDADRVLYGTHLYANHLRPFTTMLDAFTGGTRGAELLAEAERVGNAVGTRLVGQPTPEVSEYQNTASYETKPFFTPPTAVSAEVSS